MAINWRKYGEVTRLLRRTFRTHGWVFMAMTLMGFVGGLSEGIGIATIIPLFALLTGQTVEGGGFISQTFFEVFRFAHIPLTAPTLLITIVLLFFLKALVQFAIRYVNAYFVGRFEQNLRLTVLRRTLYAKWPHLMKHKTGHLESILLYDIDRGATILHTISSIIVLMTTFAAYTTVAMTISWPITVTTLVIGTVIFYFLKPVFWHIRQLQSQTSSLQKEMSHFIAEHAASVKSLKAMTLENPVLTHARKIFESLRSVKLRTAIIRQASLAALEPLSFIVVAVLFLLNWKNPGFSIISFAVIMYLVQKMFNYINAVATQIQNINDAYPYLKTVIDWRHKSRLHAENDTGTQPFSLTQEIAFNNISFHYRKDKNVLENLSLTIPHGNIVGLAGHSGGGKTTVVDLLLRLLEPEAGTITADGIDICDISLHEWRNHVGYVAQDAVLLNASVRENIRFYASDVTNEDIIYAAQQANIHETIMSLPEGYDASVGERGMSLSGGQRQRIILARALVRKPAILVLDEATSALDAESERAIQSAIIGLKGKVTIILIAHRLASILTADTVLVIDQGRVIEVGHPTDLLANSQSEFAKLYTAAE